MQEAFLGPYTESLCVHLQSGGRELTSASLIVGPALSDSIAGPAALSMGLILRRDRIGRVRLGRSKEWEEKKERKYGICNYKKECRG